MKNNSFNPPTTFKELKRSMGSTEWRSILIGLLRKIGKQKMVVEPLSERYHSAEVLRRDGFQLMSGKSGMDAYRIEPSTPTYTPIRRMEDVLERVIRLSQDNPSGASMRAEVEIVRKVLDDIEKIRVACRM
ncbi:MAG TPA: hypothetical protein VK675_01785 [Candidatus Paceibacterota bacterium]|nr:hypothetical protein [Candidatus Paceibacterota bacterium]